MTSKAPSEPLVLALKDQLQIAQRQVKAAQDQNTRGTLIQIPRTGRKIATTYEQFRNAAEYTEEHLLLQRAIRRFYKRDVFLARRRLDNIGEELIVELTQSGYLRNNSVSSSTAAAIRKMTKTYMHVYGELRQHDAGRDQATEWILDIMSVETEEMLNPHGYLNALAFVAYQHYLRLFPRKKLATTTEEDKQYELSLYIAIHLALLKSDSANIRYTLMKMHQQAPSKTALFIGFNQEVDRRFSSSYTQRLRRAVSRYGAPFRVLKGMTEDRNDIIELLDNRELFMMAYDQQVRQEYRNVKDRLNRGITKSVIFLFITKVLIGLAVEIPYDLAFVGHVVALPLLINLLVPPLYIASLKIFLNSPSGSNGAALHDYIDRALYGTDLPPARSLRLGTKQISAPAQVAYGILLLVPVVLIVTLLRVLDFSFVQGVIFFVFLSTASFLGFRLSRIIRELELETKQTGFLSSVGDFFYLPFIVIGQWLSSKYARVNAVAFFMDMAIELPLKTALRLTRQWTRFLSEQRDEIY